MTAAGVPAAIRSERLQLVGLCLAAGALVVGLGTRLGFFNDDWYFLLQRPGLESRSGIDVLLAPHNGSMAIVLAAMFKLLVAAFGMHSQWPFRLVTGACWAALGAVVYLLARPRVGHWPAWLSAALVLFLGPAWEVALFISGIDHLWALALGLGALLALERGGRRSDVIACALLTIAVACSNTGMALVAGAAVALLLARRPRALWVVAVPVAVYGAWWLGYGHTQPTGVTAGHIAALPGYVFDALSYGLASLLGLSHGHLPSWIRDGHLMGALALAGLAAWLIRGGRPRATVLPFAAALLAFWLLAGASAIPGRGADASRYQLTDVVLILLVGAELARDVRLGPRHLAPLSVICLAIVASNLFVMHAGYAFLRGESALAAADTGALRIAGPATAPGTQLVMPAAGSPYLTGITAGRYFAQVAAHGAPAFASPAQLLAAPAPQRAAADRVLIAAEAIRAVPVAHAAQDSRCVTLASSSARHVSTPVAIGPVTIANRGHGVLVLSLSRFSDAASPQPFAFLPAGATAALTLRRDFAAAPWRLAVTSPGAAPARATVCAR